MPFQATHTLRPAPQWRGANVIYKYDTRKEPNPLRGELTWSLARCKVITRLTKTPVAVWMLTDRGAAVEVVAEHGGTVWDAVAWRICDTHDGLGLDTDYGRLRRLAPRHPLHVEGEPYGYFLPFVLKPV